MKNLFSVKRRAKMYDYKIYTVVSNWPQEQFASANAKFSAAIHYQTDITKIFECFTQRKNHGYIC